MIGVVVPANQVGQRWAAGADMRSAAIISPRMSQGVQFSPISKTCVACAGVCCCLKPCLVNCVEISTCLVRCYLARNFVPDFHKHRFSAYVVLQRLFCRQLRVLAKSFDEV